MNIQSLSVVVPNKKCINDCKFCVSKMHANKYQNNMDISNCNYHMAIEDYIKRLEFARDNGCNTIILTGSSEPQQNKNFLATFGLINKNLKNPFKIIEIQTTGTLLDNNYIKFLKNHVKVTSISISVSSFNDIENKNIIGMKCEFNLKDLCKIAKDNGLNLRLSLNLNNTFNRYTAHELFMECKKLGADQVTLRKLYSSSNETEQGKWIKENIYPEDKFKDLINYIKTNGLAMERLEFYKTRYNVMDMSTVVDEDSMNKELADVYKYLILREDCKLYTKWDTNASLIF